MSSEKPRSRWKKPGPIRLVIALLLALLIMDRGAAWLYEPKPGSKDVILYTTTWCPYCELLRAYLKGYNIPYIERDVEKSLSGLLGWWTLGHGRGVPVSVIGEQVVRGYDLEKISAALRALGYSIQGPEDTGNADLVAGPVDAGNTPAPQAAPGQCEPPEDFAAFYAVFKADDEFKIQRTKFPLHRRALIGDKPYRTDEITEIGEDQVLMRQEAVYLDQELLDAGGYTEHIYPGQGESRVEITADLEESGLEPITIHKFHKVSGCWFLVEFVSYEYYGSVMILSSLEVGPQG